MSFTIVSTVNKYMINNIFIFCYFSKNYQNIPLSIIYYQTL